MADARERLARLIELAGENTPEKQRALAFELCDLLTDWPVRYPAAMREPFEALLDMVLRRLDDTTRSLIAERLAGDPATAIALLYEFYFDLPPEARACILEREATNKKAAEEDAGADETPLIDAARHTRGIEFTAAFGRFLHVPVSTAQRIVEDPTGNALAVACKAAHMRRATYSALALLTAGDLRVDPAARYERLSAFDTISADGARRLLAHWRGAREETAEEDARAA